MKKIDAYLYSGFLDSGKTTYIQDNLFHDYFYKYGTTLILSFEEGEVSYDEEALRKRRCFVSYYRDSENIAAFCMSELERIRPDRVIIEDNVMISGLAESLPEELCIKAKTALFNGETLALYFNNLRNQFTRILKDAVLVLFNRADNKDDLLSYSTPFRLISPKASYLWESPMGYHEKAFGIPLTYDRSKDVLIIGEEDYACFYLDSLEQPEEYEGKTIELTVQVHPSPLPEVPYVFAGRKVFTCCFADIQTLGFFLAEENTSDFCLYGWYHLRAEAFSETLAYQKRLCLRVKEAESCPPPEQELIGYTVP
ncbi:MAG: hypothetical protein IKD68_00090 [Solobacterium sp.]|nr:hypothetical protein [Solobacterium sp.]